MKRLNKFIWLLIIFLILSLLLFPKRFPYLMYEPNTRQIILKEYSVFLSPIWSDAYNGNYISFTDNQQIVSKTADILELNGYSRSEAKPKLANDIWAIFYLAPTFILLVIFLMRRKKKKTYHKNRIRDN